MAQFDKEMQFASLLAVMVVEWFSCHTLASRAKQCCKAKATTTCSRKCAVQGTDVICSKELAKAASLPADNLPAG